jgi:hypothetical protein
MWYIQLSNNIDNLKNEILCGQLIDKDVNTIYDNIDVKYNEDYKILHNILEEHIIKYINNNKINKIELYIYNYGIDNAILLLNDYNNRSKKIVNTTSKSLLFVIILSKFKLNYIIDNEYISHIYNNESKNAVIIIQKFWRNILSYKNKIVKYTINKELDYLLNKINNEIVELSSKRILIYIVNKFRKRFSKTLRI